MPNLRHLGRSRLQLQPPLLLTQGLHAANIPSTRERLTAWRAPHPRARAYSNWQPGNRFGRSGCRALGWERAGRTGLDAPQWLRPGERSARFLRRKECGFARV
jgi:hypothetical protein